MRTGLVVAALVALTLASFSGVAGSSPSTLATATSVEVPTIGHAPAATGHATIGGTIGVAAHGPVSGLSARFPHPAPIPSVHPQSYFGHYYAGSVYNGTPVNSTSLSATWNVPEDNPQIADFYYVLLSVWDDAGSYDQVGFTNSGGVWGFTYSSTDYCASYYYYNPDAFSLNDGTTYTFAMTLAGGSVNFSATYPDGSSAFYWTQYTGGHHFLDDGFYTCDSGYGNATYYDLTDYEEVYQTTNTMVPYDWHFTSNLADAVPLTPWSVFTSSGLPGAISVLISTDNTLVANEPYELGLGASPPWYTAVGGGNKSIGLHTQVTLSSLVGTPSTVLGGYVLPGGWTVKFAPASGTGGYSSDLTITVPAGTGGGNYTLGLNASDSTGASNQITVWVNLISAASMSIVASPHPFGDVGQTTSFYVTSGGGVSGVSVAWNGLPTNCAPGNVTRFLCLLTTPGTYPISVTARDSYGDAATSAALQFLVYRDPTIVVTPIPSYADVGQPIGWYTSVVGGAGAPFTYLFAGLPTGCTVRGPNATCTPTAPGTFNVTVTVTDASGYGTISVGAPIVVLPAPAVALVASTQTADADQRVWVNATATGGTGSFTYTWPSLPSGCVASSAHAICSFPAAGGYYVNVEVQDAAGAISALDRIYLTISPAMTVRLGAPLPSVDLGQSTTLAATVAGGAPSYHYTYAGLPSGCASADTGALACTPNALGSYPVQVFVSDANQNLVNATLDFTVFAAPTLALTVTPASVTLGSPVTFQAVVTGGSGGASFVWSDLPGGCLGSTSASVTCTPSGAGNYAVIASMTDTDGAHANATAVLSVTPAPVVSAATTWELIAAGVVVAAVVAVLAVGRLRRRPGAPDAERAQ